MLPYISLPEKYMTKISSLKGMRPKAWILSSPVLALNKYRAFGEHEWLNLEAIKQIPELSSLRANEFVLYIPSAKLG